MKLSEFMTLSEFQEEIIKLFLRLNGYITTGLIIHSEEKGNNKTQIDLIGVRFPFHNQEDRGTECCDYLQIPKSTTDIIICEVKGGDEKNQFNPALRDSHEAIEKLIKWIGILPIEDCSDLMNWLVDEMKPKEINTLEDFPRFDINELFSIRPMIFNLDDPTPRRNQKNFIYGDLILNFIWDCLRSDKAPETCSRAYPLNLWGPTLKPIVEFFKDENRTSAGNISELYECFGYRKK